jgi:BMFP domain-containing protein YqiC
MQSQNRLFDDLARVAGGALGTLAGVRHEIESLMRHQFERLMGDMNLVSRDEFDAVQAMAARARSEQEALAARVAALEELLAAHQAEAGDAKAARRHKPKGEEEPAEHA